MEPKKKKIIIGVVVLCVLIAAVAIVYFMVGRPKTQEGAKEITVKVFHLDGSEKDFTYHTDEEMLGAVLIDEKLAEGEQGDYGLYIMTVDGETADEGMQQWWCVTKGGEQVNTGADATPITDGDVFELTLTEGY